MQNNAVFEETKEYFYQYFLNLFLEFCMHKKYTRIFKHPAYQINFIETLLQTL